MPPTLERVHPTQIYEAVSLLIIGALLLTWRRRKRNHRVVLGAYFALAGATRFLIEFVRVNEQVLGPLTVAQVASLAVAAAGVALLLSTNRSATIHTSGGQIP